MENYKIINKWKPVIENIFNNDKIEVDLMEYYCLYSDKHSKTELDMNSKSCLPSSLRVLTKLNLKNKKIILTENLNDVDIYSFSVKLLPTTFENSSNQNVLDISESEKLLLLKIRDIFNNLLTKYDTIIIYKIISKIAVDMETDILKSTKDYDIVENKSTIICNCQVKFLNKIPLYKRIINYVKKVTA